MYIHSFIKLAKTMDFEKSHQLKYSLNLSIFVYIGQAAILEDSCCRPNCFLLIVGSLHWSTPRIPPCSTFLKINPLKKGSVLRMYR